MFSVNPSPSWWLREYTYLSYYHHQIGSMNYYPLFRARSWNNGMRCMSFYILIMSYHIAYIVSYHIPYGMVSYDIAALYIISNYNFPLFYTVDEAYVAIERIALTESAPGLDCFVVSILLICGYILKKRFRARHECLVAPRHGGKSQHRPSIS